MNVKEIDWTEEVTESDFKEVLNDYDKNVIVCGMEMQQGNVLYECDYIAFREMYNNHIDAEEREQGKYRCGNCDEIYQAEEEAEECCQVD